MAEHVYPLRYAHTDGAWKPSTSPTTIDQARGTMIAIHRRQNPTIPMLQSVLSLSAHPEDLHLLNTTVIIDDCIQYLDWRRKQNLRYPFGCEEGYLYFRIIVLAIGVCIIFRNEALQNHTIDQLRALAQVEDTSSTLMRLVAGTIDEQMNKRGSTVDLFIGWANDSAVPIMTQSNALLILDIMWKDRKRFLVAWAKSHSPPLNGLFFILWGCVRNLGHPDHWMALCDIFWRYSLVAETGYIFALRHLNKNAMDWYDNWLHRANTVDSEDAASILLIFTERLTPGSQLYRFADRPALLNMLLYAFPKTGPRLGTEDLLVPALRALFNHFWASMASAGLDEIAALLPEDTATILNPLCTLLNHMIEHTLDAREFIHATAGFGVIEAISRGLVLVKEEPEFDGVNAHPLVEACHLFISMLLHTTQSAYQGAYDDSFVEWFKTLQYLRSRDSMLNTNTQDDPFYVIVEELWIKLGDLLGYVAHAERAEAQIRTCAYTRCPDPHSVNGARFRCSCERSVTYCGMQCQQADWATGYLSTSHRHTCTWRK